MNVKVKFEAGLSKSMVSLYEQLTGKSADKFFIHSDVLAEYVSMDEEDAIDMLNRTLRNMYGSGDYNSEWNTVVSLSRALGILDRIMEATKQFRDIPKKNRILVLSI